jgi:hypothetical protein
LEADDEAFSAVVLALLVSVDLPSPLLFSCDIAFLRDSEG